MPAAVPLGWASYEPLSGEATIRFWVDHEEELVRMVHSQLLPDGTYPVRELMQLLTYKRSSIGRISGVEE